MTQETFIVIITIISIITTYISTIIIISITTTTTITISMIKSRAFACVVFLMWLALYFPIAVISCNPLDNYQSAPFTFHPHHHHHHDDGDDDDDDTDNISLSSCKYVQAMVNGGRNI